MFDIIKAWNLPGWVWTLLMLLIGVGALPGCSQNDKGQWITDAQAAADLGMEVDVTIIYGSGHVAGQSFNLTGSNGVIHGKLAPKLPPSSQPIGGGQ